MEDFPQILLLVQSLGYHNTSFIVELKGLV
jgi:hypothetical protein